eukprot:gene20031-26008_t
MLSYEEFQAEQKRERLKEELKNNKTNTNIKSNKIEKDKNKSSENNNTSTLYVIGEFVESYHEKDSRNAIEDMLAGYKEEVDTLNEALKIAAMDIAEAAQTNIDDELSDDNLDDIDYDDINNNDINNNNDDDDEFVDAPISMYDKSSNINTLIHKITKSNRADNISSNVSIASKSSNSTFTAKSSSNNNKTTFVINQDYSYSKK